MLRYLTLHILLCSLTSTSDYLFLPASQINSYSKNVDSKKSVEILFAIGRKVWIQFVFTIKWECGVQFWSIVGQPSAKCDSSSKSWWNYWHFWTIYRRLLVSNRNKCSRHVYQCMARPWISLDIRFRLLVDEQRPNANIISTTNQLKLIIYAWIMHFYFL